MAGAWRVAAVVVAFAAVAWAEDPPAKRHENKVSQEAKAAIDTYDKLVYRPAEHGLVSLKGMLVPTQGAVTAKGRRFEFTPPGHVDVAAQEGADPKSPKVQAGRVQLGLPFEATLYGAPMAEGDEYDAEVVVKEGRRVLIVTNFRAGVETKSAECGLDERGLLVSIRSAVDASNMAHVLTMRLGWRPVGGQFCIDAIDASFSDAGAKTGQMKYALRHSDVGGVHLVTGYDYELVVSDGTRATMSVQVSDLVLNGKNVDLPKPKPHENRVSPEAKAAIDAYAKLVERPTQHGLVSVSGTLMPEWTQTPKPSKFEFKAPNVISVALSPDVSPDSPGGKAAINFHRFALLVAFDGIRIGETTEYDADFVEREGSRLLEVVEYRGDARTATSEFALDPAGLVASLRRRDGADPAVPTSDVVFHLNWAKTGDLYRIESVKVVAGAPDKATHSTYAFTYSTIDGLRVLTAYSRTVVGPGAEAKSYPYHVEDLVLNGKTIVLPKPGAPSEGGK